MFRSLRKKIIYDQHLSRLERPDFKILAIEDQTAYIKDLNQFQIQSLTIN